MMKGELPVCPACLGSVVWLSTGGVSGLGATAGEVTIVRDRKIAARISKIWKLRPREPLPSSLCLDVPKRWQCKNEQKQEIHMDKNNAKDMQHRKAHLGINTPPIVSL